MADLAWLKDLKNKVQTAEDFSEPWDFFLGHMKEDRELMSVGKCVKNIRLQELIQHIGQQLFKKDSVNLDHLMLVSFEHHHFVHGTCHLDGYVTTLLYFEDIDVGMASVMTSLLTGQTMMMRFTAYQANTKSDSFFVAPSYGSRHRLN